MLLLRWKLKCTAVTVVEDDPKVRSLSISTRTASFIAFKRINVNLRLAVFTSSCHAHVTLSSSPFIWLVSRFWAVLGLNEWAVSDISTHYRKIRPAHCHKKILYFPRYSPRAAIPLRSPKLMLPVSSILPSSNLSAVAISLLTSLPPFTYHPPCSSISFSLFRFIH